MWAELPTAEILLDCRKPFSFYFDIVAAQWKSSQNNLPLHRVCTLARKQAASNLLIESALTRPDVREEIDALDQAFGTGGAAEAVSMSFFIGDPIDVAKFDEVEGGSLLGQVTIINYREPKGTSFTHSYIYEAILIPPSLSVSPEERKALLNNYVCSDHEFTIRVKGREFRLRGNYYCQQNSVTHVCAHACLRMALSCQFASNRDPLFASNNDPSGRVGLGLST